MSLGYFATAEEAALRIARSPEVQAAAVAVAAEEQRRQEKATEARQQARQQAQAEGLMLRVTKSNKTGYVGVYHKGLRYEARVRRGGG